MIKEIPLEFVNIDNKLDGFIGGNDDLIKDLYQIDNLDDLSSISEHYNLYLEWIESELMKEVVDKTGDFYDEMRPLSDFVNESDRLVADVNRIHSMINPLIGKLEKDQAELMKLDEELKILNEGIEVLKEIPSLNSSKDVIQKMLDAHEFKDALHVINNRLNNYKEGENYFPNIKIMKKSYDELVEMKIALDKMEL